MDPNATISELLSHVADGRHDDACESLSDLIEWLAGGGFVPDHEDTAEVLSGAYWAMADSHGGQGTEEYRWLSVLSAHYVPGASERAPEGLAAEVYRALTTDDPARCDDCDELLTPNHMWTVDGSPVCVDCAERCDAADIFRAACDAFGEEYVREGMEGDSDWLAERYAGTYDSEGDWAAQLHEDCGTDLGSLGAYVDWEAVERDAELCGDICRVNVGASVIVFWSNR